LLLAWSGDTLPDTVFTSGGTMLLRFSTNANDTAHGWSARYIATTVPTYCNGLTNLTSSSGTFSDGSGSLNYGNFAHCSWLINPPGAYSITLNFQNFSTDTITDILKIYDGFDNNAMLLGSFSGSSIPSSITSSGGLVFIEFITNDSITSTGWDITYSSYIPYNTSGIVAYEYWYDDNYASKNLQPIIPQQTFNLNTSFNTIGLALGLHSYHIRFFDHNDQWSSVISQFFIKQPPTLPGGKNIISYEYWIDNDYSLKVNQTVNSSASYQLNTGISADSLQQGLHSIHIRYKDNGGQWSSVVSQFFIKQPRSISGVNNIIGYEYWFDNDYSSKVNQTVNSSETYQLNTGIAADSLQQGLHSFHIRYKDAIGQWSSVISQFFIKIGITSGLPNLVSAYRYWFDMNDTNIVTINLTTPVNPLQLMTNINTCSLSPGNHTVHFQFKDEYQYWSSVLTDTFNRDSTTIPLITASGSTTICQGDSVTLISSSGSTYLWSNSETSQNITVVNSGNYKVTVTNFNGCSAISSTTAVTISPTYFYSNSDSICIGSTLLWHGQSISQAGIYYDSLSTIIGCDSIFELTLIVNPTYFYAETDTICDNSSLVWHSLTLTTTGVYYDSLLSVNGCDSIYQLTLTVNPTYFFAETDTICDNGSLVWHGSTLTTAGIYYDSLLSINGCDSVHQLTLTVNPTCFFAETDTICDNSSLLWHGSILTTAGIYYDSLLSINACDSVYQLTLTVNLTYFFAETDTICDNSSMLWHSTSLTTAGVYYDSLLSINACDSVCQLTLTVNPTYFYAETDTICDNGSLLWHGSTYTTAGVYYDSLLSMNACDSVYQLTLTVNPSYYFVEQDTICYADSLIWQWISVIYYSVSDTLFANYNSINGCDSIYELKLIVNLPYYFVEQDTICFGDSLLWQGNYYSVTGTYNVNYNSINGCDSVYQLILTVNPTYFYVETDTICNNDSLFWHGSIFTTAGVYYDSLLSINGCDSVYQLNFTVNPKPISFVILGDTNVIELQTETYNVNFDSTLIYSWNINNGIILSYPSSNSAEIQWGNYGSGLVSAISTNQFGCNSDTVNLHITIGAIGMQESTLNKNINIFPNPSKGIFNYEISVLFSNTTLKVYNSIGDCVFVKEIKAIKSILKGEIDLSKFPKGVYYLRIESERELITRKLVLQ